ncbi:uncharacterized protein [Physcomitrium patens]|uniref:Uncharacterized protein n=1 Tax=Physcomitrium patens TaxID=3218 RepID=A0A2K1IR43_PHYPA|nr:keratin-associated protein 5-1-like [Physcomitrium patens]PNR31750.1 hypothetical protein PHYPA_025873 [Physcomitrium patens]|eukprot:XP_024358921.1 keratin-associated protein 5-1-like [Physcomitrella patens]
MALNPPRQGLLFINLSKQAQIIVSCILVQSPTTCEIVLHLKLHCFFCIHCLTAMASIQHGMSAALSIAAMVLLLLFAGAADATACPKGYKDCDKNYKSNKCETNTLSDINNCGDCGAKCPVYPYATSTCREGKCVFTCKAGWKNCNNKWSDGCETDVGKDINNCGGCGTKCNLNVPWATTKCNNCKCENTCKAGWKDCNKDLKDGCEVDVGKDVNNCGACGTKCKTVPNASTKCSNHKCMYTCNFGWKNCNNDWTDGCETEVSRNINNCGGCGSKCNSVVPYTSTKCSNQKCEYTCKAGWKDCNGDMKDGCETDVGKDLNNCGGCGKKCNDVPNASTKCSNYKCEYTCNDGWANCNGDWTDGCEIDVTMDVDNCGSCGAKCNNVPYSNATCSDQTCVYTCEEGWGNCNDDWEDGCEADLGNDIDNCGACSTVCEKPKFFGGEAKCSDGSCDKRWCIKGMKFSDEKKCCVEDWWPFGLGHGDK